jgi:hypothetical protein
MPKTAPKRVALFALTDAKYGGWVTYTAHLKRGFEANGLEARVLRVGEHTESKSRPWSQGLNYQNISRARAAEICQIADIAIIAVAAPKRVEDTDLLLNYGAALVIHDPTEIKGNVKNVLSSCKHPVIVVRRAMVPHVLEAGADAIFIKHPYLPDPELPSPRCRHAVAYSRVDFDKNTGVIAEANEQVPDDKRVLIYGAENRLYTHHKLDKEAPNWRKCYQGEYNGKTPWAGKRLADSAYMAVDLSTIKGDGGGTQYTHLEAFDSGAALVLHENWMVGDPKDPENEVAEAAYFVSDAEDLAALLVAQPDPDERMKMAEAGRHILAEHEAGKIAKEYEEALS